MKNCLITKLNGVTTNSELPKFGEFKIRFLDNGSNNTFSPVNVLSFRGDNQNFSVSHETAYNWERVTITGPVTIFIKDDYTKMTRINTQQGCIVDLNLLKYRNSIERVEMDNLSYESPEFDFMSIFASNPNMIRFVARHYQPSPTSYNKNIQSYTGGLDLATSAFTHIACNMEATWSSRSSSQIKIYLIQGIDFKNDLDKFLIDMAACQGTSARIYVYGTLTGSQQETDAINTLKSSVTEFFINEVNIKSA